jgi:CheY-like chemotaxis protein
MMDCTREQEMPLKALVADDTPSMRKLIAAILEAEGLTTSRASDGEEAIRMLDEEEFQFAIIDLVMPKRDGLAVLDHIIRNKPALLKNTIIVTAHPAVAMREQLHSVCEVVEKQHEIGKLKGIIRSRLATPSS